MASDFNWNYKCTASYTHVTISQQDYNALKKLNAELEARIKYLEDILETQVLKELDSEKS